MEVSPLASGFLLSWINDFVLVGASNSIADMIASTSGKLIIVHVGELNIFWDQVSYLLVSEKLYLMLSLLASECQQYM